MVSSPQLEEATRTIEALLGVPPAALNSKPRRMTPEEKRTQATRIKRFLALPPPLQEGILRYGENIQKAYRT